MTSEEKDHSLNNHAEYQVNALAPDILGSFVDRSPWIYWDTINARGMDTVEGQLRGFVYSVGQHDPITGQQKLRHDTNAPVSGVQFGFGAVRCMVIESLGVYFPLWMPDALISELLSSFYLEFRIAEKIYREVRGDVSEVEQTDQSVIKNPIKEAASWEHPQEEIFDPREFSRRTVRVSMDQKYVAPAIPFEFLIVFSKPVALDFTGIRPIMVPIIEGQLDRAVQ